MFTFKQFRVEQDRTAMKVGTDGVLLGAWAEGGATILDVGTGTGLIALMMAQRFEKAEVLGIDIDQDACLQARDNVLASPFASRVSIRHSSLQAFDETAFSGNDKWSGGFDAIVSNPPYFEHSLKNPDAGRATARHSDSLPFADLFGGVGRLLADNGVFSAIVPTESLEHFCAEAVFSGFFLSRRYDVKTTPNKPAKRCLVAFRRHRPESFDRREVCLQDADGNRSEWYQALTEAFYL